MCRAKDDDYSAGSDGADQLLLHRSRQHSVLGSAQKGLSWPVCFQGRKNKERSWKLAPRSEMTLTRKNTHTGIGTDIRTTVTFGRSAPLWLCWLSCACCSFSTVLSEEQQVSRLHPWPHQPLLLMFLVRMRKQCWSWMWEWRLLLESLFDCNKEFFSSFFLINQWWALYAVVRGQWLPELSQKSNFQKSEVLNTCTSDFVQSDCKQIYRRSDCIESDFTFLLQNNWKQNLSQNVVRNTFTIIQHVLN